MGFTGSFSRLYTNYRKYYIILAVGVFVLSVGGYGGLQNLHVGVLNVEGQDHDISSPQKTISKIKSTKTTVNPTVSIVSHHDEFSGKVIQDKINGRQKPDQSHQAFGITADQMSLTTTTWYDDTHCENYSIDSKGNAFCTVNPRGIIYLNFSDNTKKRWTLPMGVVNTINSVITVHDTVVDSKNNLYFLNCENNDCTSHSLANLNITNNVFTVYDKKDGYFNSLLIDSNDNVVMTQANHVTTFDPVSHIVNSYNIDNCDMRGIIDPSNNLICISRDYTKIQKLDRSTNTMTTWDLQIGRVHV